MIRESIARHLGRTTAAAIGARDASGPAGGHYVRGAHASHQRLPLVSGDEDGACLIEPAVRCNHCGYCLSLGH